MQLKKEKLIEKHIFINPELTPDDARIDKILRLKVREFRENGISVRIRRGAIEADGIWYVLNEETGQLIERGAHSRTTRDESSKNE